MSGVYRCKVYGAGADAIYTNPTLVYALQKTEVTKQPVATYADLGNTVTFEIGLHEYTYNVKDPNKQPKLQWYKGTTKLVDDVIVNGKIAGATSSVLTIRDLKATDYAEDYHCEVVALCGNVSSKSVYIRAYPTVSITAQPADASACVGGTFTLTADGAASDASAVTYQWTKNGTAIAGATKNTYTVAAATAANAGTYALVVTLTNGGKTATSGNAIVAIDDKPSFTTNLSATLAGTKDKEVKLTVASANATSYQWYKAGVAITGATTNTYTIAAAQTTDDGVYTVVATNSCGTTTSAACTLTVTVVNLSDVIDYNEFGYGLSESTPNPVSNNATIKFVLPTTGNVKLTVVDMLGNTVSNLVNSTFNAGTHNVSVDASNLSSGVYFYTLEVNGYKLTRSMIVAK
jgi:hypothetical protein